MPLSTQEGRPVIVLVVSAYAAIVGTTTYVSLHLYEEVQLSDAIVLGTVTDAERAIVRVDETLKGVTDRSIHLVEYVDGFSRVQDRRPLVAGTQELMFLTWAAHTGYQRVRQPTPDLVDAYLKLWSTVTVT